MLATRLDILEGLSHGVPWRLVKTFLHRTLVPTRCLSKMPMFARLTLGVLAVLSTVLQARADDVCIVSSITTTPLALVTPAPTAGSFTIGTPVDVGDANKRFWTLTYFPTPSATASVLLRLGHCIMNGPYALQVSSSIVEGSKVIS